MNLYTIRKKYPVGSKYKMKRVIYMEDNEDDIYTIKEFDSYPGGIVITFDVKSRFINSNSYSIELFERMLRDKRLVPI